MLLDLLIVLAAAKLAAEAAERLRAPAVLVEILVGVLLGPSALGLVESGEVLVFLAELGVILLLVEVGLQMDLGELAAVGRASLMVAVVGVVLPFAGGFAVAAALGQDVTPAIFIGAALTATSVGITARVFGDLRALSTVEARTVLGAAVADDVIGLVILTVVVRVVSTGSLSFATVAGVAALALAFLVVAGGAGVRAAPWLFSVLDRRARASGTVAGLALVFALGMAELAHLARLAPIVGAFVAGLSLGRTEQAERIRRDLRPVANLLVPVFFVQIGMEVDVGQLLRPSVMLLAGALLVVAIVGKIAASVAAVGSPGDRWVIGLGMLPRGEVGLIFAGLGLRSGVLDESLYAALLIVVLVTTLMTPPLLRWRLLQVTSARHVRRSGTVPSTGGSVAVVDGEVVLQGQPDDHLALRLGLEAACLVQQNRPGPELLDWFGALDGEAESRWDPASHEALFALLRGGNARSWRFLETTGLLDRVLPELADSLRRRRDDASELDPVQVFRWVTLEQVHRLADHPEFARLEHPDWLLLAALLVDVAGDCQPSVAAARELAARLELGEAAEQEVALLLSGRDLLRAAAQRPDGLDEERVLPLAIHLERPERARALYLLTLAQNELDSWVGERAGLLHDAIQQLLSHGDLTSRHARDLAAQHRRSAVAAATSPGTRARLERAPLPWLVGQDPADLARLAALIEPLPPRRRVRVAVVGNRVEVAARDRRGLLAAMTGVLAEAGLAITTATTATWPDGGVVMSFTIEGPHPDPARLQARLEAASGRPRPPVTAPEATVEFDDHASPWHTIADFQAPDRPGLLHALTATLAGVGVSIHSAQVQTADGLAHDRFELTDHRGAKLGAALQEAVRAGLVAPAARPGPQGAQPCPDTSVPRHEHAREA